MEGLAKTLGFSVMEDWYTVTLSNFMDNGGSRLIQRYQNGIPTSFWIVNTLQHLLVYWLMYTLITSGCLGCLQEAQLIFLAVVIISSIIELTNSS